MRTLFISLAFILPGLVYSQPTNQDTCDFYEFSIFLQIKEEGLDKDIQLIFDNLDYESMNIKYGTLYLINQGTYIEDYTSKPFFEIDTISKKLNPFEVDTFYRLTRAIFNFGYKENKTACDIYLPLIYDGEIATIELDLGFRGNHNVIHMRYAELDDRYNRLIKFLQKIINAQ